MSGNAGERAECFHVSCSVCLCTSHIYDDLNPHPLSMPTCTCRFADVQGPILKVNAGLLTTAILLPKGKREKRPTARAECCTYAGRTSCCQFGDVSSTKPVTPSSGRSFVCYLQLKAFEVFQVNMHSRISKVHMRGGSKLCLYIKHLLVFILLFRLSLAVI